MLCYPGLDIVMSIYSIIFFQRHPAVKFGPGPKSQEMAKQQHACADLQTALVF